MRTAALVALLAIFLPASLLAQAPTVNSGECLYLLGAPAGEPGAATEEFRSGSRIYDGCTYPSNAVVGRDAPHRLHAWTEFTGVTTPRGCLTLVWSEHDFRVVGGGVQLVSVSMIGDVRGLLQDDGSIDSNQRFRLVASLREVMPDGSDAVLAERDLLERDVINERLLVDDAWGATLSTQVAGSRLLRARLTLEIHGLSAIDILDFGSPGSGFGAGYVSIRACTAPMALREGIDVSEIERDLYEKRCLPSLWMPSSAGGRLEAAVSLVESLVTRADGTGDAGVNVGVAHQRLERAAQDVASGSYQRACRNLSDAVRALTTP